jgi:hypothetical protein
MNAKALPHANGTSTGRRIMGVMEEQARFLVAKYGTARGATGGPSWTPAQPFTLTPESIMVLVGLTLLAIILVLIIRDVFAAREREALLRRAHEHDRRNFIVEKHIA